MPDVLEINRIDELAEYRPVWHSLMAETPGATFFQSLEWLETYWRHDGQDKTLRTLIVSDRGTPIGILPLVVLREKTKVGSVRVLTYPLHDWGSTYGPISADPGTTLAAGLEHVRRTPRDWDMVELRWVDATRTDGGQTERAMRNAGFQSYKTIWNKTAVVDLTGTWDQYLARWPSKWRTDLRRSQRRVSEQGELSYVRYRPGGEELGEGDPRWDLYDACEQIAQNSWQGSSTTGTTLSHETVRSFLRDVHAAAARAGALDLNLLLLDGKPLAFGYNYHFGRRLYGLRVGFDPEQSRAGPGNVLYGRTIEDSFRRGDRMYDLGVGSMRAKERFQTRIVSLFRYSHFHPAAPKAQLLRLKRWVQERSLQQEEATALATGV
jgi:CelD/BcsL family acetyltransferase involved in cellulose biosynthesis